LAGRFADKKFARGRPKDRHMLAHHFHSSAGAIATRTESNCPNSLTNTRTEWANGNGAHVGKRMIENNCGNIGVTDRGSGGGDHLAPDGIKGGSSVVNVAQANPEACRSVALMNLDGVRWARDRLARTRHAMARRQYDIFGDEGAGAKALAVHIDGDDRRIAPPIGDAANNFHGGNRGIFAGGGIGGRRRRLGDRRFKVGAGDDCRQGGKGGAKAEEQRGKAIHRQKTSRKETGRPKVGAGARCGNRY
jgi:hypothetical protein